jgi:hypothetical protein
MAAFEAARFNHSRTSPRCEIRGLKFILAGIGQPATGRWRWWLALQDGDANLPRIDTDAREPEILRSLFRPILQRVQC